MNVPFNIFPVGPNKRPMIEGWQEHATRDPDTIRAWQSQGVKAWGIPTGAQNGLFVIDLDTDDTGAQAGKAALEAMPSYAHLLRHISVTTPSGGSHIYLKHFDGARNTQPGSRNQIAPQIDTRGEGGYVVAPGSVVATGEYTGVFPTELPPVPLGLRAMLLKQPPPPAQSSNFNREAPTGEVEELLSFIPADVGYGEWLSVLMALHDRYNGSPAGLAIADAWSATGTKYRAGDVAKKWQGFTGSGVHWATVPALARQHGADLAQIGRAWS